MRPLQSSFLHFHAVSGQLADKQIGVVLLELTPPLGNPGSALTYRSHQQNHTCSHNAKFSDSSFSFFTNTQS